MDPTPVPPSGNEPWWALAGGSVVGLVLAAARAYFWIRKRLGTVQTEERKNEADEREASRRAAAGEAWELNARLMAIITGHEAKYDALSKKYDDSTAKMKTEYEEAKKECETERRKCEVELATMCGRLSVVEAWARKKGMPLDEPETPVNSGSGPHIPLTGGIQ